MDKVSKIRNIYLLPINIIFISLQFNFNIDTTHFKTIMSLKRQPPHQLRRCPKIIHKPQMGLALGSPSNDVIASYF